jgi:hypothetical protein
VRTLAHNRQASRSLTDRGTANHRKSSLCLTCRFATVVKGRTLRDEIIQCRRLSDQARITFPVAFCTGYADQRLASIREMEEIAWILRSDPHRNHIGFVEARKLKPKER